MRPFFLVSLLLVSAHLSGASLLAAKPSSKDKEKEVPAGAACPVTGRPIDKAVSIDYQGAKLYFSAPDCIAKYQAEPARYTVGANYQLAVTGQARQVACPFTGKALNPNVAAVKVGVLDVGFCCRACQQTVANADLQTQYTLVFGDAFATGYKIVKK